ncbi:DUF3551 domain-containing protein [Rhodoplanes sp. Z2-YC6860]|uniref:DUF3551 domain-containing protein n=1 Tax=Rhodoplanes sp. Z2-YC6860 TaxID=674703 RepID=UPI0012ECF2BD|nr:DUF3551 domain-containing protein [Rhodoplanes sp. Z2-YC6860]
MRPGFIAVAALIASAAINSAQAAPQMASKASDAPYRWCVMYGADTGDGQRHCYFHRLSECRKAITGADGVCVPNELRSDASATLGGAGQ